MSGMEKQHCVGRAQPPEVSPVWIYVSSAFGRLLQMLDVVTDTYVLLQLASVVDSAGRMRHRLWVGVMAYC